MSVICIIGLYLLVGIIAACVLERYELRKAKTFIYSFDGIIIKKTYVDRFDPELKVDPDGFIAIMFAYPVLIIGIIVVGIIKIFQHIIVK